MQKAGQEFGSVYMKRLNYIRVLKPKICSTKDMFQPQKKCLTDWRRIGDILTKVCLAKTQDFASSVAYVGIAVILEEEGKIEWLLDGIVSINFEITKHYVCPNISGLFQNASGLAHQICFHGLDAAAHIRPRETRATSLHVHVTSPTTPSQLTHTISCIYPANESP
jgi:hypothetical protein